jgi:hypothetical protein
MFGSVPKAQVMGLLQQSVGLLMPSLLGPTNYPPLEALQLGVPAIISDAHHFDFPLPEAFIRVAALDVNQWAVSMVQFLAERPKQEATMVSSVKAVQAIRRMTADFEKMRRLW